MSSEGQTFEKGPFGTKSLKPDVTKLGAEFLGSFLVVFVICSNYSAAYVHHDTGSNSTDDHLGRASSTALAVFAPTSIACVYMAMHYALKGVSGGVLNPAITVSLMWQRTLDWMEGFYLVAAQLGGGAAAGFATLFLYGWDPEANIIGPRRAGFLIGAPLVEALYTCMICFVYLNVNRDVLKRQDGVAGRSTETTSYYALAVGFVYIAGGVGGRYVSGGAYNPAVSLGINFMGPNWHVITLPIYIAAQLVGATVAVMLFYIVRKEWYVVQEKAAPSQPESEAPLEGAARAASVAEQAEANATKAMKGLVQAVTDRIDPEDTCEFLGTMFISLTISLNQIALQDAINENSVANVDAAAGKVWSLAACIISLMYAMSDCSGGLFNPAITLTYAVRFYNTKQGLDEQGKCVSCVDAQGNKAPKWERIADPKDYPWETLKYFVTQLVGGAAGMGLTILVWFMSGTWPVAAVGPGEGFDDWQAMFAEFYGTFLICYAMVVVMLSKSSVPLFGPFVVGGCVIAAGYAFGALSGGYFNPAIVVGDAVGSKLAILYTFSPLMYVCGQLIAGFLAGAVFRLFTHKEEFPGAATPMQQQLLPVLA